MSEETEVKISITSDADPSQVAAYVNTTKDLRKQWEATSKVAQLLLSQNREIGDAYGEATQKLIDAHRKTIEYGGTLDQGNKVVARAIELQQKHGLSIAKTAALMEELNVELQNADQALKLSGKAFEYWQQRGGRVEDAVTDFTNVVKGEGTQAFQVYGERGRRVAAVLDTIENKALRGRIGLKLLNKLTREGGNSFSFFSDRIKIAQARLAAAGISVNALGYVIKSLGLAVFGAGSAFIAFTTKAIKQFIAGNKWANKEAKRLSDTFKVLIGTFGSAVVGGKATNDMLNSLVQSMKDLTTYINNNQNKIFNFVLDLAEHVATATRAIGHAVVLIKTFVNVLGALGGSLYATVDVIATRVGAIVDILKAMTRFKSEIEIALVNKSVPLFESAAERYTHTIKEILENQISLQTEYKKTIAGLWKDPFDESGQYLRQIDQTFAAAMGSISALRARGAESAGKILPKLPKETKAEDDAIKKAKEVGFWRARVAEHEAESVSVLKEANSLAGFYGQSLRTAAQSLQDSLPTVNDFLVKFGSIGEFRIDRTLGLTEVSGDLVSTWDVITQAIEEANKEFDKFLDPKKRFDALKALKKQFTDSVLGMLKDMKDAVHKFAVDTVTQLAFAFGAGDSVKDMGKILLEQLQNLLTTMAQSVTAMAFSIEAIKTGNFFGLLAAGVALSLAAGAISRFTSSTSSSSSGNTPSSSGANSLDRLADRFLNEQESQQVQNINVFIGSKQLRNDVVEIVRDSFRLENSRRRANIS